MSPPGALEDIRVLDLSSVGPGARCSRILSDYGATVVQVGAPARRGSVQIEPPYFAYGARRGMQRVRIDLKAPEGRRVFLRLAARADVVIESFRPGVADRLGVGWEAVSKANERIVYCSTSGYGQEGPYARWAGHDLDYLAVAGYLACSGRRADGGPALPGATVADAAAGGMQAAIAILAALLRRHANGRGERLDVCVVDGVLQLMTLHVDEYLATGEEAGPGRSLLTGRYACYDVYPARDGKWLAVAAIEPVFFANLCQALDLGAMIPHQLDDERQDEIRNALRAAFARRDRDDWVAVLAPADTCVAPVYGIAELVGDRHFAARGAFVEAEHPEHGRFRQVGPVLAGAERVDSPLGLTAEGATDTDAVLGEAGLSAGEIEAMRREGVVS